MMYSNYIITKDKAYALINYEEIIAYHKLPFYKKWFTKQPLKELTELKSNKNFDDLLTDFVLTEEQWVNILGDLVWTKCEDTEEIIIQMIYNNPYYTTNSLHICEERYIIGNERYRMLWVGDNPIVTIERLTDATDCKHKNIKESLCLDCNKDMTPYKLESYKKP